MNGRKWKRTEEPQQQNQGGREEGERRERGGREEGERERREWKEMDGVEGWRLCQNPEITSMARTPCHLAAFNFKCGVFVDGLSMSCP